MDTKLDFERTLMLLTVIEKAVAHSNIFSNVIAAANYELLDMNTAAQKAINDMNDAKAKEAAKVKADADAKAKAQAEATAPKPVPVEVPQSPAFVPEPAADEPFHVEPLAEIPENTAPPASLSAVTPIPPVEPVIADESTPAPAVERRV